MQKQIKKNIKQRYIFKKMEKKRLILKILTQNLLIKPSIRWKINSKFETINQSHGFLTRIKNICTLTGRSKSIYRIFKLSRIQLKSQASQGLLPGVSKNSW